ncbi:MAG: DUF3467 domain-containing protein [Phycisphaeraceae bacterium]
MSEQQGDAIEQQTVTPEQGQQQTQLQIDESQVTTYYSSTARVWGSAEELLVDLAQGLRQSPNQPNVQVLRPDARIIMSPAAAKRLAIALSQAVQRYESTYGTIETDPRKRAKQSGQGGKQGKQ